MTTALLATPLLACPGPRPDTTDGKGNGRAEFDWFYMLPTREQNRLRYHMSPSGLEPDEWATHMEFDDVETAMSYWQGLVAESRGEWDDWEEPEPEIEPVPTREKRHMGIARRALRTASHHKKPQRRPQRKIVIPQRSPIEDAKRLDSLRAWAASTQRPSEAPESLANAQGVPEDQDEVVKPSVRDRPADLDAIVGQANLVGQLKMTIAGSQLRDVPMSHCLFVGPAGFGKTSLASIVAQELGYELIQTTGMMLRKPQDLVGLLLKASPGTVLFVDELHALSRSVTETLYEILEDLKVSTLLGSGSETVSYVHQLTDFVFCGATTRPGLLTEPMRQRFGVVLTMDEYSDDELAEIIHRGWDRVEVAHTPEGALAVAKCSKGVPRRALTLAERVVDVAAVQGCEEITEEMAYEGLALYGIDQDGLTDTDWRILDCLCNQFGGRTVGITSLAAALNLDERTIVDDHEPYLVRSALVARTKTGRLALPAAFDLFKEEEPA